MKSWQLIAPKELKECEIAEDNPQSGEARVKIFNVLLNAFDFLVYKGDVKVEFPIIPGRFAVGKVLSVGEDTNGVEKGNRVFIDPIFPNDDFKGDSTPLLGMDATTFAGQTGDGFLTPFAVVKSDNLYVLPESVSDESALYTYLIALAVSAIDKIGEVKGKYIAVVGGTALGIILCQLLAYYQAVPILIDARTARLDFAKDCGVTYALLNDENLDVRMNEITGAAFADGAIYVTSSATTVNTVGMRVTAPEKTVVFCGNAPQMLQVNIEYALKKQLHLIGVSQASDNILTAINLLANKAVNVSVFTIRDYSLEDLPKAYKDKQDNAKKNDNLELTVIDCYGKL